MQIKTFVLYYQLKNKCDIEDCVILFYYSRNDPDSFEQGKILDRLVENFDVQVFAIERDYAPELGFLEQYYDIASSPSLIINYAVKKEGLIEYKFLKEEIIDES